MIDIFPLRATHYFPPVQPTNPPSENPGPNLGSRGARPVFIVGVTGMMALDPACLDRVRGHVHTLLAWLMDQSAPRPAGIDKPGLGLGKSIVLLSAMAPGVDQLVAEVARKLGLRVEVPMPFPLEHLRLSSTYEGKTTPPGWTGGSPWAGPECLNNLPSYWIQLAGDDQHPPSDEAFAEMRTGDTRRDERRRRYRAVGEFIAAHSDLLIAIDSETIADDERVRFTDLTAAGTRVIVQSKRRGPTHGLLPLPDALDWADHGPVLYLHASRWRKAFDPVAPTAPPPASAGETGWKVWHPYDALTAKATPGGHASHEADPQDLAWERLTNLASAIIALRAEPDKSAPSRQKEAWKVMLPRRQAPDFYEAQEAPPTPPKSQTLRPVADTDGRKDKLVALAAARRWIADINQDIDTNSIKPLKAWMLNCGLAIAASGLIAELWLVKGPDGHALFVHHALRCVAAVVAVGLTFYALYRLLWHQGTLWTWLNGPQVSDFNRLEDSRAIAEGLRVQFYWSAAGVGESVAANYLQRARGELNWIRVTISNLALPYETDRRGFLDLDSTQQTTLLRSILWGWVQEQRDYFADRVSDFSHRQAEAHAKALFFLWAGVTAILWGLLGHLVHSEKVIGIVPGWAGLGVAVGAIFICGTGLGVAQRLRKQWKSVQASEKKHTLAGTQPQSGTAPVPLTPAERDLLKFINQTLHRRWFAITMGSLFGGGITAFLHAAPTASTLIPDPERLILIFRNLTIGASGLIHLATTRSFLGENIHRYQNMKALFHQAYRRINGLLDEMEHVAGADHLRLLQEVQGILVTLGKEALNENTDWHVLHRTHPVEPLTPGG